MTGEDPTAPKRGRTFEAVAREFIEKQAKRLKPRYRADALRSLELNIFPDLGAATIGTLEAPSLLGTLRKIEARGAHEQGARVRALCSQVFRFAIASGYAKRDPAADLRGAMTPHKKRHHAALDADGLKDLLAKVKASEDEAPVTRLGLLVLAHTALTATTTDAARHDNRVNFFDLGKQHAPGHGCKLNTRYSVRPNPNAGSRPGTIQPSSGAKPTLKLVRVVGTKYIDYFTDGTKTYSFPGNPDVDSNLNKPNAPIPTRGQVPTRSRASANSWCLKRQRAFRQ